MRSNNQMNSQYYEYFTKPLLKNFLDWRSWNAWPLKTSLSTFAAWTWKSRIGINPSGFMLCQRTGNTFFLVILIEIKDWILFFENFQVQTFVDQNELPSAVLGRCPTCLFNFKRVFCDMMCHPGICLLNWNYNTNCYC